MSILQPGSSRRLTGPNRWTQEPAVIVEATWQREPDRERLRALFSLWSDRIREAAERLHWDDPRCQLHVESDSVMMTFVPPLDGLYTGCELAEEALQRSCSASLQASSLQTEEDRLRHYEREYASERNPALLALQAAASQHAVPFLWDDDECSLGFGKHATRWSVRGLPEGDALSALAWEEFKSIPSAFVTGTNGKTTTSRMMTRMFLKNGDAVGSTSTDGLCLNEEFLERGDWTGPGGARTILRHSEVEVAILETARGGILRRGLSSDAADVAILTNVSDDHLGEWGIETVGEMAEVKFLIRHGLRPGGILLLNADSAPVVEVYKRWLRSLESAPPFRIGWWSTRPIEESSLPASPHEEWVAWYDPAEATLCFRHEGTLLRLSVHEVPITLSGLAEHNLSNALSAGAAALRMNASWEAVCEGLRSFKPSVKDNPGRTNLFEFQGARVVLDFGHNPDGVKNVAALANRLQPDRALVMIGQAGDRNDESIQRLADAAMEASPSMVLLKQMSNYLRGRDSGEVLELLEQRFLSAGLSPETIVRTDSEEQAVKKALAWSKEGDLLLLFVQEDFPGTVQLLRESGATEGWSS